MTTQLALSENKIQHSEVVTALKIEELKGNKAVSAKALYEFLGMNLDNWSRWYKKNIIEDEFFTQDVDYQSFRHNDEKLNGGRPTQDFLITIEFAKHLCMLSRTQKGKEARQYFIDVEKNAFRPMLPQTYKEALQELLVKVEENEKLQLELNETNKQLEHKTQVLTGATESIDIYEQRELINRIIRNCKGGNYGERWNELYRVFKETYHIDLIARRKGYDKTHSPKCKTTLEYAEIVGEIPRLFKLAIKIYESDFKEVLKSIGRRISDNENFLKTL